MSLVRGEWVVSEYCPSVTCCVIHETTSPEINTHPLLVPENPEAGMLRGVERCNVIAVPVPVRSLRFQGYR